MKTVIKIEGLYKEYRLGLIGYGTLQEDLQSWWARFRGKPDPNSIIGYENESKNFHSDRILALNDVDLKVKKGERLGIIGKNGAGKTTLLKILSSIASPTKGIAKINGRVASLIAVGTGFHGELTGRENIYLNGAILGLKKIEIDQRFDAIVNFSGVEKFIDTPVKRYSSGMGVRLGFAVAAHLDPDILMVDEVLAVGDIEFQKKAVGAMQSSTENGKRTILFVSHNMETIRNLCNRCIVLDAGKVRFDGKTDDAISEYKRMNRNQTNIEYKENTLVVYNEEPERSFQILSIRITDNMDEEENIFSINQPICVHLDYVVIEHTLDLIVNIFIRNHGKLLVNTNLNDLNTVYNSGIKKGRYKALIKIPALFLKAGDYQLGCSMGVSNFPKTSHEPKQGVQFKVHNNVGGLELTTFGPRAGKVLLPLNWDVKRHDLYNT
jgi:lipopolysaccharide transport system ATP-binding protein